MQESPTTGPAARNPDRTECLTPIHTTKQKRGTGSILYAADPQTSFPPGPAQKYTVRCIQYDVHTPEQKSQRHIISLLTIGKKCSHNLIVLYVLHSINNIVDEEKKAKLAEQPRVRVPRPVPPYAAVYSIQRTAYSVHPPAANCPSPAIMPVTSHHENRSKRPHKLRRAQNLRRSHPSLRLCQPNRLHHRSPQNHRLRHQ